MKKQTTKFDEYFKTYTPFFFGDLIHWHWFKAQAIAESSLNPLAVSPVGAQGLMQLMPGTRKEVAAELGIRVPNPYDPETNIKMGIYYDRKMWDIFKKEEGLERLCFMLGAYNAGAGNIIDAQELTSKPNIWKSIVAVLPQVTDEHAMETINYVDRIIKFRLQMIGRS